MTEKNIEYYKSKIAYQAGMIKGLEARVDGLMEHRREMLKMIQMLHDMGEVVSCGMYPSCDHVTCAARDLLTRVTGRKF